MNGGEWDGDEKCPGNSNLAAFVDIVDAGEEFGYGVHICVAYWSSPVRIVTLIIYLNIIF